MSVGWKEQRVETQRLNCDPLTIRNEHYAILYDSPFFPIASRVEAISDHLPNYVASEVRDFEYRNPPELARLTGSESRGSLLVARLNLPDLPAQIPDPRVYCLSTPESNAMTIGRLIPAKDKTQSHFQLARFHLGPPAQLDMQIAMYQAAQIEKIQSMFTGLSDPEKEAYIVYITREGQLTDWQKALYQTTGIILPANLVHARHIKDQRQKNPFGRVAMIYTINLEGMDTETIDTLVVCDNTASAMQQVGVISEIARHIEDKNGGQNPIRKILVVSPLLTTYGASIISYYTAFQKMETTFVCSGAILGCNRPDRYYSPVINNPKFCPDPKLAAINYLALGPKAQGVACARCDWTESFFNPSYALRQSDRELEERCSSSNQEVLAYSRQVTQDVLEDREVDPSSLTPYSTLNETQRQEVFP